MKRTLFGVGIGLAIAVVVGAIVAAPLALLHRDASGFELAYGNAMVNLASSIGARQVGANPLPASPESLQAARAAYTGSCSQCHGAAGDGRGAFGSASFPPATDLTSPAAKELSDSQVFFIIRSGLGFTAMPGYGAEYSEEQIWGLVGFIRALQNGQEPHLVTLAPSAAQLRAANLETAGNARRGAEIFAAHACGACHGPAGALSIDPRSRNVRDAVRSGRPGMPCYPAEAVSDGELLDLLTYVATFPPGQLGNEPTAGEAPTIGSPCQP
jgi:mono/diheme cytochrome c family protein